jgi:hypothetical protein
MEPASTTNPLHGATDPYQPSATPTLTTSTSSDWLASKITSVDLTTTTTTAAPQAYALAAHEEGHVKEGAEGHGALVAGGGGGHGGGGGGDDGDDEGDGHDDGHGHSTKIAPTRVPDWLGDIIEKVFKIRKRKTTVEVRLCSSWGNVCARFSHLFPPPPLKRWNASAAWCSSSRACTCCPWCRFK